MILDPRHNVEAGLCSRYLGLGKQIKNTSKCVCHRNLIEFSVNTTESRVNCLPTGHDNNESTILDNS